MQCFEFERIVLAQIFDREEGLASQSNWLYLTGPTSTLASVLNAYGVAVANAAAGSMTIHADLAYVINSRGVTRWILNPDPGTGAVEQASFSNLLVSEIEQVMHS